MHVHWATGLGLVALAGCATPQQQAITTPTPPWATPPCVQTGMASWYRPDAGRRTTSEGTKPSTSALTAAHATLPFGTQLLVTDVASGRTVVVRISDRGPFRKDRIIDLSASAAQSLGIKQNGVAQVRLEIYGAALTDRCPFTQMVES